eukprot:1202880-Amphidinium_carterae.1
MQTKYCCIATTRYVKIFLLANGTCFSNRIGSLNDVRGVALAGAIDQTSPGTSPKMFYTTQRQPLNVNMAAYTQLLQGHADVSMKRLQRHQKTFLRILCPM